ncbi:EscJ/YscJ/HrcJ family type III secretion inner membrane ring protein [Salmonella enterica]|uniref:Lipoprotein n=5 Tax=Salmonella enterica TaxID=28901 RepID=A0A6X8S5X2_SALDZ|nr:type III secretion inner membrane ring lipoprotein SctJ [Salmonella enterica]EAA4707830.1 EscJ/YscJ/HrcJ family type III secretion inner membrane ring protein [Salmonella enterica subsp. diarizonae]EAW1959860.1 EscJ/YscJ/HrcJ family type III secretion inner membrane ring protein [Salmonella enterica subsp. enterica]EBE3717856.1 EscJ/YscJ/HrcJ family type III secretion inner membrane ring protein [Salmonella enterica subsp. diarizonae serovar 42:l,v:1,5,7]EBH8064430.1 EscJ/YscJ/HrcJ family ty
MTRFFRFLSLLILVTLLCGCKAELYDNLSQDEANQMVALLLSQHIDVDKTVNKNGLFSISIDKSDFISAVEILRLHGYPQKKYRNVEDVFPSDQLVTSPGQELSKIVYLKEQNIERMLSDMDGVISARVSIAQSMLTDDAPEEQMSSVSVFIKYSPETNLQNSVTQIKGLVHDSIPDLDYDKISIVLQPVHYLNPGIKIVKNETVKDWLNIYGFWLAMTLVGGAWIIFLGSIFLIKNKERKRKISQNG